VEVPGKEKEAIHDRYLGQAKKKKRIRRLNERKFVFDWEVGDDTSYDYNPLYNEKHHIQVASRDRPFQRLFGRNFLLLLF
jgi:ATP-dependent RNA helicase DDX23/PRP28